MIYKSAALKDLGEDFHKQASLTIDLLPIME